MTRRLSISGLARTLETARVICKRARTNGSARSAYPARSPVYETEPVDYTAAALVPEPGSRSRDRALSDAVTGARRPRRARTGRVRGIPKGPRIIDIDIFFFGRAVVRTAKLEIPHPGIAERRFVLMPLADLAPDLRHPVTHKTVREMLDAAPTHKIRRLS